MKIKTEYVCMGIYIADDEDMDPEENVRGTGKSPEEAIGNLFEQLLDRAEEDAYKCAQAEAAALISDLTREHAQERERVLSDAEELANALRDVLAGHPVRNADELINRYSPLPEAVE
jgi:hypothetical protein